MAKTNIEMASTDNFVTVLPMFEIAMFITYLMLLFRAQRYLTSGGVLNVW